MKKTLSKLRIIALILSLCIAIINLFFQSIEYKEILNGIIFILLFFVIFIEYYRK
jgi:hypothetical protein